MPKTELDAIYVRDPATGLRKLMGYEVREIVREKDGNKTHKPQKVK